MDSFIFINNGQGKTNYTTKSHGSYMLDRNDSGEDCTTDYETLVYQRKDSLYYSESEEEIVEEGKANICHQKAVHVCHF